MRTFFSRFGKWVWRFMVIFSFIVNIILVIVLLGLGLLLFDIKNNIAEPLVGGLHGSFVGLDEATIDTTIPVRDTIPVQLTVPLQKDTTVVLTEAVPLTATAMINLNGSVVPAPVSLSLPVGMELPVHLDLDVPIDQQLPISLDVRAVIPLAQTQLHDVADNLRLLFEPLALALHNLPSNFDEAGAFVSQLAANNVNLLEVDPSFNPWPGFSRTAGLNYPLFNEPVPQANQPVYTGIVQRGGIPALDAQLRPEVYAEGGPDAVNAQAATTMTAQGVQDSYYDGDIQAAIESAQQSSPPQGSGDDSENFGIVPTATPGG